METQTQPTEPTQPAAPAPVPVKYFKKELISNRLTLPNGRAVKFEPIGDTDSGVLATTDQSLSSELDKAAAAGRGGVVQISEQEFQDLKKNPTAGRSQIRSLDAQSIRQLLNQRPANAQVAAEVKQESSAPMEVPKGLATVSSRRKLKELQEKQSIISP